MSLVVEASHWQLFLRKLVKVLYINQILPLEHDGNITYSQGNTQKPQKNIQKCLETCDPKVE